MASVSGAYRHHYGFRSWRLDCLLVLFRWRAIHWVWSRALILFSSRCFHLFLGPGAVIAQVTGVLIGVQIGLGNIPPHLASTGTVCYQSCRRPRDFIPSACRWRKLSSGHGSRRCPFCSGELLLTGAPTVLIARVCLRFYLSIEAET